MKNVEIKLPEKHYVTLQQRENACPLGFMTPWGEDAAAKKRMGTADSWAASSYYGRKNKEPIEAKTLENELLTGFRIMHSVDRSNRFNKNILWRIEDPRGFELEISSGNMETIINECNIEKGEILEPCIWGRLKSANVLLPETSQEYKDAIENTERVGTKVTFKDIPIGSVVLLHDGREARYLGKFYTVSFGRRHQGLVGVDITKTRKPYFYMENDETSYHKGPTAFTVSSPKISKIVEKGTNPESYYEIFLNDLISYKKVNVSEYGAIGVITSKPKMDRIQLEEIDIDSQMDTWNITRHNGPRLIVYRNEQWAMMDAGDLFDYPVRSDKVKKTQMQANLLITPPHLQETLDVQYDTTNVPIRCDFSWGTQRHKIVFETIDFDKNDVVWYRPYIPIESPKTKNSFRFYL